MHLQKLLSYVRRMADDYQMIEQGDSIAVAVSGGKDSLSLLMALKHMQRFYPKVYELRAIGVSLGFPGFRHDRIEAFCRGLDVPFTLVETDIGSIVFEERKEPNPCSLCAKMRKGALNQEAKKLGCNKIALGHNRDDCVETFFMSLFYEGRMHTFQPISYLDRMDLTVIRPMLYVPEKDVALFARAQALPVVKNPCPADGRTKREEIKSFLRDQAPRYGYFQEKIFGAIKRSPLDGWNIGERDDGRKTP